MTLYEFKKNPYSALLIVSFLCTFIYLKILTISIALKMITYKVEMFANIFYY